MIMVVKGHFSTHAYNPQHEGAKFTDIALMYHRSRRWLSWEERRLMACKCRDVRGLTPAAVHRLLGIYATGVL